MILDIRNLSLSIRDAPILRDVSMAVDAGEVLAVIGESGSGKSMTALTAMQLLPEGAAATGAVRVAGTDVLATPEPALCAMRGRDMSIVFQEPMTALNPLLTIGDQVAEAVRIHGRPGPRERAAEALARAGLPGDRFPLGLYPHQLSGGQRQRVCIAMAIALRPRLLIADEPTTALDVTTQAGILDLLRGLVAEDGMALMLISHDLAVVADLADRIAIMRQGEVVEMGGPDLFRTMRHPYTRALYAASGHRPERSAAAAADSPLLEVRDVVRDHRLPRKTLFGPRNTLRAVDGVSFTIRRGECLGLVGESGCGKSTLTRAILGLEPLQGGRILLDGAPVAAARHRVQVVFQDPYGSFNPRHTVGRIVAEPFHLRPAPDQAARVAEALTAVGLSPEDAAKHPHAFSGGQRQRIAIARALILRPDLVLLDEAVSALDVSIRAQILDLLADLQTRYGLTYLFISHDLTVVRAITDRVLVMRAGKIVEEGPTAQVLTAPQHPYTAELLAAAPALPQSA